MGNDRQAKNGAPESVVGETLKSFMDIAFSVIVAECFTRYSDIILAPAAHLLAFSAILATVGCVVLSYVHFRISLGKWPYLETPLGYCRFGVDVAIVGVYGYQLYSITELIAGRGLCKYTFAFFLTFLLYLISGLVRRREHRTPKASRLNLLVPFTALFVAVHLGYRMVLARYGPSAALNGLTVAGCTLFVVAYRIWRGLERWKSR